MRGSPSTSRRASAARTRPRLADPARPQELLPRKRPTQERSQRKFDALLAPSRDLLTDVGFESFTCEEVASRADVPIGTLYQFFANKYVIVCELNRQDLVAVSTGVEPIQRRGPLDSTGFGS